SSAVMVTAMASGLPAPSEANTLPNTAGSSSPARQISSTLEAERARSRLPPGSHTALVCAPPTSQPTISAKGAILVKRHRPRQRHPVRQAPRPAAVPDGCREVQVDDAAEAHVGRRDAGIDVDEVAFVGGHDQVDPHVTPQP